MLQRLRQRLKDMRTLHRLFIRAELIARAQGQPRPGSEHFLLAALELPDGSARRAFERVGADPDALPAAIEQQYRDALAHVGIHAPLPAATPLAPPPAAAYDAQASGQDLIQTLARTRKGRPGPLRGAHVVALIARTRQGVAARALQALRLDAGALARAAELEGESAAAQAA